MAETAITAVLSKFGELAASEAKLLLQVGDDMTLLRDRLEWLQAFLRDADWKRWAGTDGLTRVWVRQTHDVAFEAEDALDEFFYEVDIESQGYQGWKKWSKYLTGFWTQIVVRLKRIKSRPEIISENQTEYKIKHISLGTLTSSTTAIAAWSSYHRAWLHLSFCQFSMLSSSRSEASRTLNTSRELFSSVVDYSNPPAATSIATTTDKRLPSQKVHAYAQFNKKNT